MIDHGEVEIARIFHRASHYPRIDHWLSVVADRHDARRLHFADFGQMLAFRSLRDSADRENVGEFRRTALLDDEASDRRIVIDRFRVRHAADGREPARDSRARARSDGLFVFIARLAQMGVKINETWG